MSKEYPCERCGEMVGAFTSWPHERKHTEADLAQARARIAELEAERDAWKRTAEDADKGEHGDRVRRWKECAEKFQSERDDAIVRAERAEARVGELEVHLDDYRLSSAIAHQDEAKAHARAEALESQLSAVTASAAAMREALEKVDGAQRLIREAVRMARHDLNRGALAHVTDNIAAIADNARSASDYIATALATSAGSEFLARMAKAEEADKARMEAAREMYDDGFLSPDHGDECSQDCDCDCAEMLPVHVLLNEGEAFDRALAAYRATRKETP